MNENKKNVTRQDEDTIDLLKIFKAMWHYAWLIILCAAICGGGMFYYSSKKTVTYYNAKVLLYVNNSSFSIGSTSFSMGELSAAQKLVADYMIILKSRKTIEAVAAKYPEKEYTYEQLRGMVDAASEEDTEIFNVSVTSTDPDEAMNLANTFAEVLPQKINEIMDGSDVRVVDYAVKPESPMPDNVSRRTLLGVALGVVIAGVIITIITLADTKIHDEEYLIATYNLPILASVPSLTESSNSKYGYGFDSSGNIIQGEQE